MVKFYQQSRGNKIAIEVKGRRDECEGVFLSFYNWGGTVSEEMFELNDQTFYFWTTKQLLIHYLENIIEHKFYLKYGFEPCDKCKGLIMEMAKKRFNNIEYKVFLPRKTRSYLEMEKV